MREGNFQELIRRSAFGLIAVYNLLPQRVVDEETVPSFQRSLQELAKQHIAKGCDEWVELFSPRIEMYRHPLRHVH